MTLQDDFGDVDDWLTRNGIDFRTVNNDVKVGIAYFVLVFSLFDQRHLEASGSRDDVIAFIDQLPEDTDFTPYQRYFDYFQNRYLRNWRPTHHYELLVDQDAVSGRRILDVLEGHSNQPAEKIGALVLIAYRIRCNLVHGSKWQTGLGDQYRNLVNATRVMMLVMDLRHT